MIDKERILKLKDDFIRLHAEYKSHCADQDNPALVLQHEEDQPGNSRQKLSAIVDRMLEIMLQIIDLSTQCEKENEENNPKVESPNFEAKRGRGRPRKVAPVIIPPQDHHVQDDDTSVPRDSDIASDQLVPLVTSLGRCLVPADVIDDLSQTTLPPWSRPGPKSKTRATSSNSALETLLTPEVRLDCHSSLLESSNVKQEPLSEAEEGLLDVKPFLSDSSSSSSDDSDDDSESENSLSCSDSDSSKDETARLPTGGRGGCRAGAGRRKKRGPKPKISKKKRREASNQKWAELCAKFNEATEQWMYLNRPAPPSEPGKKLGSRELTADQQRDIYDFYTQHKDHHHPTLVWNRIIEKYYLINQKIARFVVKKGISGKEFGFKPKHSFSARKKDVVQEMIAYCKANPITFTCGQLARKYGWASVTVSKTLREHGIRVYSAEEKRAMRLNLEGKQYVPFYRTKEEATYHRMRQKERDKRRRTGDLTDGRSARYKDPNWRNIRQEIGVPEGVTLYAKEERREREAKKAVLSRLPPEERKIIASTLYMGSANDSAKKKHTKGRKAVDREQVQDANQDAPTQVNESESSCSVQQPTAESNQMLAGQHNQPSTSSGWSLQFDPHSGSLFHHSTRSSTSAAAAACVDVQHHHQQQESFTGYSHYYQYQ